MRGGMRDSPAGGEGVRERGRTVPGHTCVTPEKITYALKPKPAPDVCLNSGDAGVLFLSEPGRFYTRYATHTYKKDMC